MLFSVLVRKSPFGVPSQESCIIIRNFLERGVAQLCPLLVVPYRPTRIIGVRDGFLGLIHPLRDGAEIDRKSTRLNSSHTVISYAVFCLKKKKKKKS